MHSRRETRDPGLPVDSSWRMVEGGENDSFDTSIVPDIDLDADLPFSSGPSHLSSQPQLSSLDSQGSNHSISDFVHRADDERVILRSPFRPSMASSRQTSAAGHRTADPEFCMPSMRVDNSPAQANSAASSRTIRPDPPSAPSRFGLRRRPQQSQHSYSSTTTTSSSLQPGRSGRRSHYRDEPDRKTLGEQVSESLPGAIVGILAWFFEIIGMAFRMLKVPLALGVALYLFLGGFIILHNMATKSITASLSPLCRVPGVSYLDLPFCPRFADVPGDGRQDVEFDDLMNVQSQFEKVLERSVDGVSLPMEMKRSETSIRDLRTLVRHSELPERDELVYELDEFVETARQVAADLQKFNTHVSSAVDSVISINRWTSRYIDSLAEDSSSSSASAPASVQALSRWTAWLFYPFQPAITPSTLRDKYIEHTALVSDRIADLIVEAQAVLRLLTRSEDHLAHIYDVKTRSQNAVETRRDDILWTLWSLVGGNRRAIHNLDAQLRLLGSVNDQRVRAVDQVSALVLELEGIQAGLADLRDRVAEPALASGTPRGGRIPLNVHVETIDRGVERLELARRRIREAENEKIRETLARGGVPVEPWLLEGRM
ncbi:hypothetical protein SODALDRAFT_320029 [Sodiomyces alkalinus F11]|uniref:Uncharacterized protein n=1 Tax=Sodiomyces alkalinus (strain CBS 110278 / VKM F-3762 / F11) TaxID=1314773 RepID=A0A3N2QA27_SODAK|nr:hypothetical protein SODALDRAFT_320029 [Sodiomyces alkalinus F11]ROT43609.1 hypothetical protein SODALDRAFT_320029 [Sodiomyces alkalinus F11]